MTYKCIVEYEYPVDHKPPVKAEIVLHGDRVVTDRITPYKEPKQGEWIPCSERLPNENDRYLAWDEYIEHDYDCASYRISRFCNGTWLDYKGKIVAWMPLPNPYVREGDEK